MVRLLADKIYLHELYYDRYNESILLGQSVTLELSTYFKGGGHKSSDNYDFFLLNEQIGVIIHYGF